MQDLFLESFSYELQLDMHSYLHKNFILAKSGCYTVQGLAISSTSDASPGLIWKRIISQNREVCDITLKI
jgi:hypothetical protein